MDGLGVAAISLIPGYRPCDDIWMPVSGGSEGVVERALIGGRWRRRKTYFRSEDLLRYSLRLPVLDFHRVALGYEEFFRLPALWTVDPQAGRIETEFVVAAGLNCEARASFRDARNAAMAVAGSVDATCREGAETVLQIVRPELLPLLPVPNCRGIDVNDSNWIFDGATWVLIDF